jgi:DNA mismatch repair protein MutS2
MCVAFDDLCARARYGVEVNGFVPEIGAAVLRVRQARHPLLLGGAGLVVPFDVELAPDERTVLVSGPNTGGKTVFIKAVGLLALMAQSGIVPPLGPESALPVFDRVFADIGDRQSISESLSTFSGHVAALRDILEHAGPGSLVLLDEVGGGTDPAEGGALAAAVLLALTRRGVVTLATTHLGTLKRLATQTVGVVNASLQFDADTLTPTYRLLKGVPGRSYGLAIARRLGLDGEVLADAERAMPQTERALDALVADVERRALELTEQRETLDRDAAVLRQAEARAAAREQDAVAREREVTARERSLEADARERARAYLLEARKTVEAALATARAAVDEATAREARRMVEDAIRDAVGTVETGGGTRQFRAGDRVRRGDGGAVGTVRSVRGDGNVVVEFGSVRMVLPAGLLEPTQAKPDAARAPARAAALLPDGPVESEVSLRRMRPDDAAAALERALDAAVLADLPFLRIIHGKGTGVLRRVVQDVLRRDPRVARFGIAPANQGGHGVTVAEFRA